MKSCTQFHVVFDPSGLEALPRGQRNFQEQSEQRSLLQSNIKEATIGRRHQETEERQTDPELQSMQFFGGLREA
jgi:hypothetical protein